MCYRCWKWTLRSEFKFWKSVFAFHIVMHPTILLSAMSKIVGQTVHFNLGIANSSEEENSDFKPAQLRLEIDL